MSSELAVANEMAAMKKVKARKEKRKLYDPASNVKNSAALEKDGRYDDVFYEKHPGLIRDILPIDGQTFAVETSTDVLLLIEIWSDKCIRFRYALDEFDTDFSYARKPDAKPQPSKTKLKTRKKGWTISTNALNCFIDKADGKIKVTDRSNKEVIHEYKVPFYVRTTLMNGLEQLRLQLKTTKKEGFFGLGDKSWETDLQGRYFRNWNEDAFAYNEERDTLYRSIPFYFGLRGETGYGLFLDNTYRTHFDFNSSKDDTLSIWAEGGEFSYYLFVGPDLTEVAMAYTTLTGRAELPPLWAIGYHQCRWSYYPETRVRELASSFRKHQIPCDSIYLDIDYMDEYRCFTWNKKHFPDPKGMIKDLKKDGFHTVVMIDPGIKVDEDYEVYQSGTAEDVWCVRPDGRPMVGPVWPPECVWPDYTNPDVRDWWGPLYKELYVKQGVSGFWNDMNEPAIFRLNRLTFPDSVQHDMDGRGGDHAEAHNIYGMQMSRATYDGLKTLQPNKRPFLLCRASFSGGQRFAALWTGDNVANWEHLAIANRQCLRLSISGFSFVGTDIGGFVDNPGGELLVRWLQLAVFHPLMRTHSMGNNADGAAEADAEEVAKAEQQNRQDQEPWSYGEPYTSQAREAINLRYQLLPYLYTAFQQHAETGMPVLRNLFFYDQSDSNCRKYGDQFLCGDSILVAPVLKAGRKSQTIYLPKGNWIDFHSGKLLVGSKKHKVKLFADKLPIYIKAGSIIPIAPVVQHSGALSEAKSFELHVFTATSSGKGHWFWDKGEGYDYAKKGYRKATFSYEKTAKKLVLKQSIKGKYKTAIKQLKVKIIGCGLEVKTAKVDGKTVKVKATKNALRLTVPADFKQISL